MLTVRSVSAGRPYTLHFHPLTASLIPISTSSLIASYGYGVDMRDIPSLPIVYFCSDISIYGFH